jgi:hypothetical protein
MPGRHSPVAKAGVLAIINAAKSFQDKNMGRY